MKTFDFNFIVHSPLVDVAEFHRDTRALRRLSPPPVYVQLHRIDPMAEGSISEFTLWFGPLPIRWTAQHSSVDPLLGFTDTQIHGPMKSWIHTHKFSEERIGFTRISEHIEYDHFEGARGILTRLLFTPFGLRMTFLYRKFATIHFLGKLHKNILAAG